MNTRFSRPNVALAPELIGRFAAIVEDDEAPRLVNVLDGVRPRAPA